MEQRERDLRAREEALAANEARMSGVQVNNWPPCASAFQHWKGLVEADNSLSFLSSRYLEFTDSASAGYKVLVSPMASSDRYIGGQSRRMYSTPSIWFIAGRVS